MKPTITIFTPAYNRAELLKKLYISLCEQNLLNFEWLVIDDGSTDHTKDIMDSIIDEQKGFSIRYYYIENGGKSRAINKALDLAEGKYFFIVDSDDILTNDATEKVTYYFNMIEKNHVEKMAGVAGCKGFSNKQNIGSSFEGDYLDALAFHRERFNISGDKAEVYYTELLKKFKTPEIEGEKFIPEEVFHYRIAADGYKLRYFNSIIYLAEYLEDGYTNNLNKVLFNNFQGYTIRCKELLTYDVGWKRKFEVIGKYSLMAQSKDMTLKEIKKNLELNVNISFLWGLRELARIYYKLNRQLVLD